MLLLDRNTNSEVDLTNADNPDAFIPQILKGEVVSDLDSSYKLKLPGGQVQDVAGGELDSYLKRGASFYSKADALAEQEAQKFDSIPHQIAAGGLGLARGLSVGLSDPLLTSTGLVSPEYLEKQEQYNPGLGTAGEIAGAVIPAVMSGGISAAAEAVAYTPAGLVNTIGKAATTAGGELAAKALPKTLSPIVQNAVTKATELGLGSAAESALFGAGQAVSESAIQNKPLTAEAILANGGYSALVGGLTGGLLGGAGSLAGDGIKKVAEKVSGSIGNSKELESRMVARGLGASKRDMGAILGNEFKQENINHAYKVLQSNVDEIGASGSFADDFNKLENSKLGLDSITRNNEELMTNIDKLKKKAGDAIGSSLDNVSEVTNTNTIIKALKDASDDISGIDFANKDKMTNFIKRLEDEVSDMDLITGDLTPKDLTAKELWKLRKELDSVIYDDKITTKADTSYAKALQKARGEIETKLESMVQSQGNDAYKEYKAAKKAFSGASDIEKLVEAQNKKAANNMFGLTAYDTGAAGAVIGGAPGAAAGFIGRKLVADYGDKAALYLLSNLEKGAGKLNKAVDDSIESFMKASRKGGTISSLAQTKDKDKSYDEKIKELEFQQQRIEEIKKGIDHSLGDLGAAAPETAMQLRDKTLNAMDFLSSRMPKKPETNSIVEYRVPESEIDKFNRYTKAVENPQTIMQNLKGGYISPEEVEVLKKVYPEIHLKLKTKALDILAANNKKKSANYQLRIQLQKLLDTKADVNLYPTSVKTLQQNFQPSQSNPQQANYPARVPGGRVKGLDIGSSVSSGYESSLRRRSS
jgi:hypothetical protein